MRTRRSRWRRGDSCIKFSRRTRWPERPNRLASLLESRRAAGRAPLDLTLSNPTACRFRYLENPAFRDLSSPANARYEPDPRGLLKAREAVSSYYRGLGADVPVSRIFLTASTSEAYGFLFRLLADAGETVLAPAPGYPLFDSLTDIHDLALEKYPLVYDGRWKLDFGALEGFSKSSPRAILWVHPNNPTGNFASEDEAGELLRFSERHDCPLVADEVFFDFPFSERKAKTFAGSRDVLSFTVSGISKILGLPQMKLSWIVVGGPDAEAGEAMRRLEIIADAYLSVNTPAQNALPGWLAAREGAIAEIRARVLKNRTALEAALPPGFELLASAGGWHAVVRAEGVADEEFAFDLLEKKNALVHPGYLFDFAEEGHFVVSLLLPESDFVSGVRLLRPH